MRVTCRADERPRRPQQEHRAAKVSLLERALVYSGILLKGTVAGALNALRRSATPGSAKPQ